MVFDSLVGVPEKAQTSRRQRRIRARTILLVRHRAMASRLLPRQNVSSSTGLDKDTAVAGIPSTHRKMNEHGLMEEDAGCDRFRAPYLIGRLRRSDGRPSPG